MTDNKSLSKLHFNSFFLAVRICWYGIGQEILSKFQFKQVFRTNWCVCFISNLAGLTFMLFSLIQSQSRICCNLMHAIVWSKTCKCCFFCEFFWFVCNFVKVLRPLRVLILLRSIQQDRLSRQPFVLLEREGGIRIVSDRRLDFFGSYLTCREKVLQTFIYFQIIHIYS